MDETRRKGKPYLVRLPLSAVVNLRHNSATPDRLSLEVVFPDGQSIAYSVPVIKVQAYSLDEIFEKNSGSYKRPPVAF